VASGRFSLTTRVGGSNTPLTTNKFWGRGILACALFSFMPFTIQYCKNGFYWIKYKGRVDLALRLKALQAVEEASKQIPIKGNIIDFRGADLSCSFSQQYEFAAEATNQSGHRGKKAAYLLDDIKSAPVEILQLAMSNRGIDTRTFTDEQEAITWLTSCCCQSCPDYKKDSCLVAGRNPLHLATTC